MLHASAFNSGRPSIEQKNTPSKHQMLTNNERAESSAEACYGRVWLCSKIRKTESEYMDMLYEWDEEKDKLNQKKHNMS